MSKVEFVYGNGGKKVLMQRRYAETLRKLGHGTYETRMLTAAPPPPPAPVAVAQTLADFAEENGVDLSTVIGTGKDGRIKKADVEAVIAARTQE
jgi:pyruvate/2-oxoglutarate dehydrogenase complex dihydrolipoamide acyltransferase (E2) component